MDDELVIMQDSDYLNLYVDKSQIPNAGEGLFAKNMIKKGQMICEFRGKVISARHAYHKNYKNEDKMI